MARLFGIVSQNAVDVSFSLPDIQVKSNVQGWGVGWYDKKYSPFVQKGMRSVLHPENNKTVSLEVTTNTFISHARFASSGAVVEQNAHPFYFKNYIFAHSGRINRDLLLDKLTPPMNSDFQSEPVDSEVFFRYMLQTIKEHGIIEGIKNAIQTANDPRGTNFLLTDGSTLYAYCYGLPLYYLERRSEGQFHTISQETGISIGSNGLSSSRSILISSEKLTNDNWIAFDEHELLTIHRDNLHFDSIRIL